MTALLHHCVLPESDRYSDYESRVSVES